MSTTVLSATPAQWPQSRARSTLLRSVARTLRPRRRLSVAEWADAHRVLSSKGSSEAGPWRTDRTPYLREIMDALSQSSPARRVVVMKAAQLGGTEVGLNWLGYILEHAPGPTLVVVPTLEVRKRWVRQRLDPMLTETPALAALFNARSQRDAANSEDIKDFPGGMLVIGGANSPASLASMPIGNVLCDEVDRFPWQVGEEGDPLGLIDERTKTFPRRKVLLVSSPTVKEASRIEEEYERSDRRRYHVPCPHCGERQPLVWDNLKWAAGGARVRYVCRECGAEIEEHHKPQMLAWGQWVAENPGAKTVGYHLSGLYSPLGLGATWAEMVADFLASKDDAAKLKRWTNTALGLPFADRSREVRPSHLMQRAEAYRLRQAPPGCLVLTAGVDVQHDRLAVQIVGWGRRETCWILDWVELPGDPSAEDVWRALSQLLNTPVANAYGHELRVAATAIDSGGHHTHEVYVYCRGRFVPRAMPVKGASVASKPILSGRPSAQDINYRGKVIRHGVGLWTVGTDTAKHALFGRLAADEGRDPEARRIHFSAELEADYYQQLTAEVFDPERNRWQRRRGRRNEALDTWVYAQAAAHHPELRVHAMRLGDWDRLSATLEPSGEAEPPAPEPPAAVLATKGDKPKPKRSRSRGYAGGWKPW